MPELLRRAGIGFRERDKAGLRWGTVYELDRCLSSDDHTDGAAIFQFPSGKVVAIAVSTTGAPASVGRT